MIESTGEKSVTPAQAVALYKSLLRNNEETWRKWIELGAWIAQRQTMAQQKARGATRGPNYARYLEKAMGQFHPYFKKLSDNGTVSYLYRCIENLDAVEAFRRRMDESLRPSHPQRMWQAFENSQRSTIEFEDDGASEDEPDEESEERAKREGRRGRAHNSEKELLAEIEALRERLDGYTMTSQPQINADRIWRRIVETMGHGARAGELAVRTGEELMALGNRIVEAEQEWQESGQ